ncbi:MAG: glycan-binding surface protein [Dysgonamonadaceae bacterium]|nr:glycan-binding surface protein [Dysgonamonadaceae bacterium]
MKTNKYRWLSYLIILTFIVNGGLFMGCDKSETDDTVILNSFGPSPALRGGELRFIGNNLKEVKAVVFTGLTPGSTVEVTDITIVNEHEIKVAIPQDAGPGTVTLKTSQGDITTLTPVTFSEPIGIKKITPTTVKAGETLTIEGDYLNLIMEVIFFDNVVVEAKDFIAGQSREKLQVIVPAEAQTGKIILSDGKEIPIEVYSDIEIIVVLPSLTAFSPEIIKPGKDLTITGENLDLVESIMFSGDKEVDDFTINDDFTEITLVTPEDIQDGTFKLIAKSTVEIESTKPLATVMPSELAVAPKIVKNGDDLIITGKDLDLVSIIKFNELEAEITTKSETEITVTVPETANSTVATLVALSTKEVNTPEFSYIEPEITSLSPTTLMAGTDLTVQGADLDLIRLVRFPSASKDVGVEPSSTTSFVVTVPADATSGNVTFITVNETEVTSNLTLTITPADIPVITKSPTSVKPGQLLVIEGTKLNLVESIIFQNGVKATQFGTRSETLLEVIVPDNAKKGSNNIELVTFVGKTVILTLTISGTDPVVDPSLMIYDFEGGLANDGRWDGIGGEGDPSDALSGKYYEITAENWGTGYWWFAENWMTHPSVTKNDHVLKMDIRLRNDIPAASAEVRLMLSGKTVNILPYLLDGANWSTGGDWKTITIPLTAWTDLSDPTPASGGDWGIATWVNESNFTGFCVDNIRYEKIN